MANKGTNSCATDSLVLSDVKTKLDTNVNVIKTVQALMLLIDFTTPEWVKNLMLSLHPIKNMAKHFALPSNDPAKFIMEFEKTEDINYQKVESDEKNATSRKIKNEFDENKERFSTAMPYIIHILYDDYGKLDHPDIIIHGIDILFYDEEEASLVHDLCYFLSEEISDDINIDIGYIDIEYMSHPKWPQLVAKATAVYMLLKANNEKYNFIEIRNEEHRDKYIEWQEKFRLERPQDC